jgi:CheY-like chemotaxis protein
MDINHEQFIVYLRSALHNIYYLDRLRRSPLIVIFGVSYRVDAPFFLKNLLIDAIEALRPGAEEAPRSHNWIVYDTLFFLYIRGYERKDVANQLGISDRQFSREQRTAIETLANYLWKEYHLEGRQLLSNDGSSEASTAEEKHATCTWSEILPAEIPASWKPVVSSVLDLIQPFAKQHGVLICNEDFTELPDLTIPQFSLRHSLLSVLEWAIPLTIEGKLRLVADVQPKELHLSIQALTQSGSTTSLNEADNPSLVAARQLLEIAGGKVEVLFEHNTLTIALLLPALEQIPVLIIDDNPDTLQLFQRYAQGTRYSITGFPSWNSARLHVEKIAPKIILLDIMMPEIDGWEVLAQLRQDLQTDDVIIIVCSILPQESLAFSLGANAFLQKPVLPQDFRNALDQQIKKFPPVINCPLLKTD